MPGIWIKEDNDVNKAREAINEYQTTRGRTMRALYKENLASGEAQTLADKIRQHPFRVLGILAFCLFILYVSINPFLQLIGYTKA